MPPSITERSQTMPHFEVIIANPETDGKITYSRLEYRGRTSWKTLRIAEKHAREFKSIHLRDAWVQPALPEEATPAKPYGSKRDYPKIDIYVNGKYVASTTWSATCKEARTRYLEAMALQGISVHGDVRCHFAK